MKWEKLAAIAGAVKTGKLTAEGLVRCSLKEIKTHAKLNAILEVNSEAIKRAQAVDEMVKQGQKASRLRLAGVPFIAKDNFLTLDTHTTAASKILQDFQAPYQATAINRLEAEGAIMVAKANLDEFAHGSSTENSAFGPTKNPHNPSYVPGGSSGGSAAAVAAGLAAFALGTDTGGSIRLPASFTGTIGLKPTYGLVSRFGVIAMASSTDVIGPITNSVEDAALVLDVMAGQDGFDSTQVARTADDYTHLGDFDLKGKKIGLLSQYLDRGAHPTVIKRVQATAGQLQRAGAKVEPVSLPADKLALAVYYVLVPAEISSNLARYDGVKYGLSSRQGGGLEEFYTLTRTQGFGSEPKRRILLGTYVLSSGYYDAYYKQAQAVRTKLIAEYQRLFKKYDFLFGPTSPTLPFKLGERQDPLSMYLADVATVGANLTGIPAISLPAGKVDGLPIGLQLMAPQGHDRDLLAMALVTEKLEARHG